MARACGAVPQPLLNTESQLRGRRERQESSQDGDSEQGVRRDRTSAGRTKSGYVLEVA